MKDIFNYLKNNVTVIGLSGEVGSGKDWIAKEHFVRNYGFHNMSLAWHFKVQCVSHGDATYKEVFDTKPPRVRRLLQILGTEQGREVWGEDIWVNTMFTWMTLYHRDWGIDKFVIPDVRFPNEVEGIKQVGGRVYRVTGDRNGRFITDQALQHPSETSLSDDTLGPDGNSIYNGQIPNEESVTSETIDRVITRILQEMENAQMAPVD